MKAKILLFLCLVTISFCCQKSDYFNEDSSLKIDYIPKIQAWVKSQKSNFDNLEQKKVDSLLAIINWSKAIKNNIEYVGDLICIPLQSDAYSGYWVFVFENDRLLASNVFIIDKYYGYNNVNDIKIVNSYYSNSNIEFSGKLTEYNITGKFIREIGYKETGRSYIKEIKSRNNSFKGQIKSNSNCTAYYWVTTWSDGSKTYEYMYTTCIRNPCEQTGIVDIRTGENKIVSNCSDGGIGGSPAIVISGDETGPIFKNLCTPSYGWVSTGVNGFTVQINNLVAPFQRDDRSLSATVVFNEACITLPISAVGTTNNATVVFNEAWNTTVSIIKDMLDNNQIPAPTDWTVKQAFKTELKKQLPTSQSAFTDGQCYGAGINISWPKYCDNKPRESI